MRYPSRIEVVQADGSYRHILIDDARQPSPSPDGGQLVFVRSSPKPAPDLAVGLGNRLPCQLAQANPDR